MTRAWRSAVPGFAPCRRMQADAREGSIPAAGQVRRPAVQATLPRPCADSPSPPEPERTVHPTGGDLDVPLHRRVQSNRPTFASQAQTYARRQRGWTVRFARLLFQQVVPILKRSGQYGCVQANALSPSLACLVIDVAQVGRAFGCSRQSPAAPSASLRIYDERRVIRQFPPQPLRASDFGRPARVVQPRQAKVVQARRSQPSSSKLAADHLAAIGKESLNPLSIELPLRRAHTPASAWK